MEFIVWVETHLAGKALGIEEVAKFDRCADGIPPEDIGLTLAEGKEVVNQVQRKIVQTQIEICRCSPRPEGDGTRWVRLACIAPRCGSGLYATDGRY